MESLRLRLRHLEDIQGLAQQGDVTLARELLRTLQCGSGGGGRDDVISAPTSGVGGGATTTLRSGGFTPGRFRATPGGGGGGAAAGGNVGMEDSRENTMTDYWPRLPATTASPHRGVARGSMAATRRPVRLAPLEERTTTYRSSLSPTHVGGNGASAGDDGAAAASPSPQHHHDRASMPVPSSEQRSSRSRMREVEHRKESYPDRHIFRLRTVHHIFPETYPLIGDLDEAIATTEHELREMHRAIQRRTVQFERLEPGEDYLVRERKTIAEKIIVEEGRLATERQVLRDRIAAAISERDSVQQRVVELQDKLALLKQHVQSVHDALERERQLQRETYPSLTAAELFGTTSATELSRMIAEKRRAMKETRQYLYKLRTNHEHSLKASVRQVEKKAAELHALQNDALLFGKVQTPQTSSLPVDVTPTNVVAVKSPEFVAFAEVEPAGDATPSREHEKPLDASPPTTPTPTATAVVAAADSGRKQRPTSDTPVSSLQVLSSLQKRTNGVSTPPPPPPLQTSSKSDANKKTRILANALPAMKKACVVSETEQRRQVERIFVQSWQLLHHVETSERLALQEVEVHRQQQELQLQQQRAAAAHVTPHRAARAGSHRSGVPRATQKGANVHPGSVARLQRSPAREPEKQEIDGAPALSQSPTHSASEYTSTSRRVPTLDVGPTAAAADGGVASPPAVDNNSPEKEESAPEVAQTDESEQEARAGVVSEGERPLDEGALRLAPGTAAARTEDDGETVKRPEDDQQPESPSEEEEVVEADHCGSTSPLPDSEQEEEESTAPETEDENDSSPDECVPHDDASEDDLSSSSKAEQEQIHPSTSATTSTAVHLGEAGRTAELPDPPEDDSASPVDAVDVEGDKGTNDVDGAAKSDSGGVLPPQGEGVLFSANAQATTTEETAKKRQEDSDQGDQALVHHRSNDDEEESERDSSQVEDEREDADGDGVNGRFSAEPSEASSAAQAHDVTASGKDQQKEEEAYRSDTPDDDEDHHSSASHEETDSPSSSGDEGEETTVPT